MTLLRVYFTQPLTPETSARWCLLDKDAHLLREGNDRPGDWPQADVREAVIAAWCGRVAVIGLPPLPAGRVASAARYALDDRLATSGDTSHVSTSPQEANGNVRLVIVDDGWMQAFVAGSLRCRVRWQRVALESDLAPPLASSWRWCATTLDQPGFARMDDGSTLALSAARERSLPFELASALASAASRRPKRVRVDVAGVTAEDCERWRQASGVEFAAGSPWSWAHALSSGAVDLLTGPYGERPRRPRVAMATLFRPALLLAGLALLLSMLFASGEWVWLQWQSARLERELVAIARSVAPTEQGGAATAIIARRYAELRHKAGLAVDSDFLPLLARAAPGLAGLPAGALKSLSYSDNHLLFDLQKLDAPQSVALQQTLQRTGLVALVAPTPTGARVRIGTD